MAPSPRDPRGSSTRAERVSIEGGTLFATVDKANAPNAPSILLSNSLATTHRIWDSQVAFLTRRYRVIRYDTRGHGASGAPPGPYEFEHLVADARAVLDHFGVAQAVFMGISLGGITGIGLALTHPDRIERLICCDARADAPGAFLRAWEERVETVRRGGVGTVAAPTLERWLRPEFRASESDSVKHLDEMFRSTPVDGYVGCVAALKRLDYLSHLGELRVPTLYVVGAEDHAISVPVMDDMARKTPGAELVVIEGSAHLPNLDNSAAFNQAIAPFLRLG